ncbi:MAG: hypothetical protein ACREA0_02730 [bacterium]
MHLEAVVLWRVTALLRSQGGEEFDLKQGEGGLTDIEFLVQYAVLRWVASRPALATHTDNCRLLAILGDTGVDTRGRRGPDRGQFRLPQAAPRPGFGGAPGAGGRARVRARARAGGALWRRLLEQ